MNDMLLQRFEQLVGERTGIRVTDQERRGLREVIAGRMAALGLSSEMEYLRLIEGDLPSTRYEWDELVLLITNNESYFFRDSGQMALLRQTILPELIRRRCSRGALRVWSVGCSTGEEVYSIAILLAELLPDRHRWDLAIVGTDINARAVARAREGRYSAWSFRMVDPAVRDRYFSFKGGEWVIHSDIRSMASFRTGNLMRDAPPLDPAWHGGFDLIICRNVFIYFERDAVRMAARRFADALADGGYLMTGHGELGTGSPAGLAVRRFPESIVYQAGEEEAVGSASLPGGMPQQVMPRVAPLPPASSRLAIFSTTQTAPAPVAPPPIAPPSPVPPMRDDAMADAIEDMIDAGDYATAIDRCREALLHDGENPRLLALLGSAHAHRGEYGPAVRCCRQAVTLDPLREEPYYTLAQIAEEEGDRDGARKLYNDILYLAPDSAAARLHLADILDGDATERAALLRREATGILEGMSSEARVRHYGEVTAGELLAYLRGNGGGER